MQIWAHRGASAMAPENTLRAFEAALSPEMAVEGIEFDVHLSADGVPVVCHDEDIKRTSDGRGKIAQFTYEDLLAFDFSRVNKRSFDVGVCRIPRLEEVLELVRASDKRANIELKTDKNPYPGIEEAVVRAVRDMGLEERVVVSSFREESVLRTKTFAPCIETAFLFVRPPRGLHQMIREERWNAVHPRYSRVSPALVADAHAHGMQVRAYTVDDAKQAMRLASLGVDGIFSNDPAAMITALA